MSYGKLFFSNVGTLSKHG